jgi:hypothetical protein
MFVLYLLPEDSEAEARGQGTKWKEKDPAQRRGRLC